MQLLIRSRNSGGRTIRSLIFIVCVGIVEKVFEDNETWQKYSLEIVLKRVLVLFRP